MLTVEAAFRLNISALVKTGKAEGILAIYFNGRAGLVQVESDCLTLFFDGQVYETVLERKTIFGDRSCTVTRCLACARIRYSLVLVDRKLTCRECAGLIYLSNSGHEAERIYAKRMKILDRLECLDRRKKWQHRRTRLRLLTSLATLPPT
jgi:hypothetical protein